MSFVQFAVELIDRVGNLFLAPERVVNRIVYRMDFTNRTVSVLSLFPGQMICGEKVPAAANNDEAQRDEFYSGVAAATEEQTQEPVLFWLVVRHKAHQPVSAV